MDGKLPTIPKSPPWHGLGDRPSPVKFHKNGKKRSGFLIFFPALWRITFQCYPHPVKNIGRIKIFNSWHAHCLTIRHQKPPHGLPNAPRRIVRHAWRILAMARRLFHLYFLRRQRGLHDGGNTALCG